MQNHLNNLPKRLKKYITIGRKLEIISDFKEQEFLSKRKFALDYGISTKQLRYYLANETSFQEQKAKEQVELYLVTEHVLTLTKKTKSMLGSRRRERLKFQLPELPYETK